MNKKILLLCVLFMTSGVTAFWWKMPNPQKETEKALVYLKQKNYQAVDAALKSLSASTPYYLESLYRGYLDQVRGNYLPSEKAFHLAFKEARKMGNNEVMQEILLARASNAYFEVRDADCISYIDHAARLTGPHARLTFFEGLKSYMQHNYTEALRLWNHYSPAEVGEWMACVLEQLFPHSWRKVHLAHCQIEKGEILAGREALEKISQTSENTNGIKPVAGMLLGLSYLKEAQKVPHDQRLSYYNMARFYFERAQTPKCRERDTVIAHVEETARVFMERLNPLSFDFVHVLEQWQATNALNGLARYLSERLIAQKDEECVRFCHAIKKEFCGNFFCTQVSDNILLTLASTLQKGDTDDLFELWELVESLHPNPKLAAKTVASLTAEEIFETIQKDNPNLTHTRHYIAFWEKLERNTAEREQLAKALLLNSKLFWQNEKQERKGLRLMEIALAVSENSTYIEKEIASFLTQLYAMAESSNMIRRLTLIHDAMTHFDITRQDPISKAAIANHLADAEYLYQVRNFPSARTHASWVLKLDPQNDSARRLAGLCSYHLGEYARALCHLKELKSFDEDASKALMISQVFAAQQSEHLCQSDVLDSLDDCE